MLVELETAAGEIKQACDELGAEGYNSPFFFIVGAGISYPPVPLAGAIIEHCRELAGKYKRAAEPSQIAALDRYSTWFGRAYPSARQRQQYMRLLIEKQPLSLASLRLGHLMSSRRLTNIVVTTNFDDFIARALRLFGEEPAICDHPRTIGRIDRDRPDTQIVHVHGSYLFYDLANLRGEVTARAHLDKATSFTMIGLLDSLLWARSPLVVGYSGWEGDIITSALRRRLRGGNPLAQSVYWFCYKRSDLDALPSWLRTSPDVRFVVPPEPTVEPANTASTKRGTSTGDPPPEPTLPADEVFERLIEAFEVGTPAIFQNPVRHFAGMLQGALPEGDGSADPYSFKVLIERLNKAADNFETATRPTRGLQAELDPLRALMRQTRYTKALPRIAKIVPARLPELDAAARKEVLDFARLAGTALLSKAGEKPISDELAGIAVFDPALERPLADIPAGQVWCLGSRSGQFGMEISDPRPHGAFTGRFAEALRDPAADADGDGKISILESLMLTSRQLSKTMPRQSPVAIGAADQLALFSAKKGTRREYGTLHAILVGVTRHKDAQMGQLAGPAKDVQLIAAALRSADRRLFAKASIQTLLNEKATVAAVRKTLKKAAATAAARDIIMLYFSGHGSKSLSGTERDSTDGLLLLLYDFTTYGGTGGLSHADIMQALGPSKARAALIVLDF